MSRPTLPFRAIIGVLMVGGLLALAACGSANTKTSGGSTSTSTGTSTSTSTSGSNAQAQQILQKVQQQNLKSANVNVSATLTAQNQGTLSTTSTGQITLNPAAAQLTTTSNCASSNTSNTSTSQQTQEIVDNGSLYVKQNGQNTWTKYTLPNSTSTTTTGMSATYISLQNLAQLQNLQVINSSATVNGVQTYQLRGTGNQTANGQSGSYTENIWVSKNNYQPQKLTVTAQTAAGQLTATANFSNWNGNQTVSVPPASEVTNS